MKSATVIETIIALLILMISFSAGMIIYTKVLASGVNNEKLRADAEMVSLADSLIVAGNVDPLALNRGKHIYQFMYTHDERYPQLILMRMTCTDGKGLILAEHLRWIKNHGTGQN